MAANHQVDMWGPFKTVALVFGLAGLGAALAAGTLLPLLPVIAAVAILVKVFRSWE